MLEFMKNKILIPLLIICALGVFFSFRYIGEANANETENQTIQTAVMEIIKQGHYAPRDINDEFSKKVYEKTLESLDYDKKFFIRQDIEQLSPYQNKLDDEIKANTTEFFDKINKIFVDRVASAQRYYKEILTHPFKFDGNDSIQLDGKELAFAKSEAELKSRWEVYLKYRVLEKYTALKKDDDKKVKDSTGYKAKNFATLEQEARENVLKVQDRYFKRLQKLTDADRFNIYMNAITGAEDPHTNYFPPEDKKQFDEMMSGSFSGIGASLQQQDDGRIKITAIVTGSPSWKGGKLKAEDIIEKVAQGDQPPVDVDGMDINDVIKLIRGAKGTEVRLTVKHADGTNEVIPIIRDKVDLEDVFAKSAVLEEDGKKIGYIYLPEFYADFNNPRGRRCATDVEKEVIKLKAAQVDGIILDLRNNGGGSLSDVVDMIGLFVGKGPAVQVRSSGNSSMVLNSRLDAPIYTGPLAVMVNGSSASASEILAAALQDYHRAVIVGSTTFGKGTVQKFVPLDQFVSSAARERIIEALVKSKGGKAEYDGVGSLKLTVQKFYRINGGSTQLKGVTPDIILPDVYDMLDETGERKDDSALPWDKIAPAGYGTFFKQNFFSNLAAESAKRIANNENFKLINQAAARLKRQTDDNVMPLNAVKYKAKIEENADLTKKLDQLDSLKTPLVANNLQEDLPRINMDSASVNKNKDWLKRIQKDAYISETAHIISDWLSDDKLSKNVERSPMKPERTVMD